MVKLVVDAIHDVARSINLFELKAVAGCQLQAFKAGAHVSVNLPGGYVRQYSLCNNPEETHRYLLAVLCEPDGRGGSLAFHKDVKEGDMLEVSVPQNHFPLDQRAMHYTLIAGGIGITPLLSMAYKLKALRKAFDVYVCLRSEQDIIFREELEMLVAPESLHFHVTDGDPAKRLDLESLLAKPVPSGLVYCCGSQRLMEGVEKATTNWHPKKIRFESFTPRVLDGSDCEFNVKIASTGELMHVGATETILEVLRRHNVDVTFSCEVGLCRSCVMKYTDGEVEHHDQDLLTTDERRSRLTVCVSRGRSQQLTLDC